MLDTIEETLRQLRAAMETHRRSLAAEGAPPGPGAAPGRVSGGRLAEVAAEIERCAGVQVGDAVAAKLERLFAASDDHAVAEWLKRIRVPGAVHPDLQLLIESLTTHETYFFRDRSQLDLLRTAILPPMIAAARGDGRRRLRLWSAGCATGEEAYTLAVVALAALHDVGEAIASKGRVKAMPDWTVEVLGTDISGRALGVAATGVYGTGPLSSFRAVPDEFLPYFPATPEGDGRQVRDELTRIVRFARFNLMDTTPPILDCDVVACRNVLIYLTPDAGRRVQDLLFQALRPSGCLLLGPTDSLADPSRYESHWSGTGIVHSRRPHP